MAKPKLYIIHGWTYTTDPWEKTLASLKKQGLEVEMLHVPGLTAPSKKVWTIGEYVRWADRHIPDGAVALGHSNGGRILLNLCTEKPNKLAHLILLDAAGVYEVSSKRDVTRSISKKLGFLKKVPGAEKVWHKLTGASDYARAPKNMKVTLSNMLESDKELDLTRVKVPTSILWGEADTITPVHQAEKMHQKIAHSTLEVFPDWTHAPYISHPLELAKMIFKTYKTPPKIQDPAEVTQAANISASMTLKKAQGPVIPSTTERSATLAFKKKAKGPQATDAAGRSAALALSARHKSSKANSRSEQESPSRVRVAELAEVEYEKLDADDFAAMPERPREIISTASVPKKKHRLGGKKKRVAQSKSTKKASKSIKKVTKSESLEPSKSVAKGMKE